MKKITLLVSMFVVAVSFCFGQLVPYRIGDQWGYSDTSGEIKIPAKYKQADFFDNHVAFVQVDSQYFLIDTAGKVLAGNFIQHGKFVNGLCPVRSKINEAFYITPSGKKAFKTIFSGAENFSQGLAVVSMKNKSGIINREGKWVREPDFDSSSVYFKSGFLLAKQKGQFFFIDRMGKDLVLPANIKPAGIFSEGMAGVYVENKVIVNNTSKTTTNLQFIDTTGTVVLSKFVTDSFDYSDYINYEREFIDGKAIINVANELAFDRYFIDKNGKFSKLYSYAQHLGDSLFLGVVGYYLPSIRIYDKHFYVMGDFSMTLKSIGLFGDGLLPVQNKAGEWGYANSNAKVIIPCAYTTAGQFQNGYAIVVKYGKYGVIDTKGREFFRED